MRVVRLLVLAGIVGLVLYQLSRVGWGAVWAALPGHPAFYALLLGVYVALPVTEVAIYRPLWRLPGLDVFFACARKRVLNEEVLGYTGEVSLYLWAARRGIEPGAAFRTVRDVNIISSAVSFGVAGALVGIMVAVGELDLQAWIGEQAVYLGAALVVAAGLVALGVRFRHYVFALPVREAARVGALHFARHVVTTAMLVAMWHLVQPEVGLGVWLTFAAVLVVIERLPFLPSKDLVFLSASVELSKALTVAAAAMAGMLLVQSGVFKLLHVIVFLASALILRERPEARPGHTNAPSKDAAPARPEIGP